MSTNPDINDLHRAGKLPASPAVGAKVIHPLAPGGALDGDPANEVTPKRPRIPLLFGPDIGSPLPPFEWLSERLGIMAGRVTLLAGPGGVGKTMLAQEMLLSVVAGRPTCWGGVDLGLSGPVVHVDYEQTTTITKWRYHRLANALGIQLSSLGEGLALASLPPVYLNDATAEASFVEVCTGRRLAVFDNLRAGTPGADENSSEMRAYIDMLTRVSNVTGCVIVLLIHANAQGNERGSTAIRDATQQLVMAEPFKSGVKVYAKKSNVTSLADATLYVRLADVGEIDASTKKSVGLRIELTSEADLEVVSSAESSAAGRARQEILRVLEAHGPKSKNELFTLARGRAEVLREAVKDLLNEDPPRVRVSYGPNRSELYRLARGDA